MDSATGLISGANECTDVGGVRHRATAMEMKVVGEEGSEVTLSRVLMQQTDRRKTAAYLTLSALLIFSTAFLLGYVVFRGLCRVCSSDGDLVPLSDAPGGEQIHTLEGNQVFMAELREMLKTHLRDERLESTLRRVSRVSHPPGSSEGNALASEILQNLQNLRMDHTWTDSHYATLQFPSRTQRNTLWFVDSKGVELEEIPLDSEAYCAYSASGTATGGLVYLNYGRQEDVLLLRQMGVNVVGAIAIMRVGGSVSFAEKVWFAQEAGFIGALIYPDPADVPQDPRRLGLHGNTVISEHVHLGSGDPFTPGFPSFNHTQFPSTQSSGLPIIPVQPISANVASKLLSWQGRLPHVQCVLGPGFSGEGDRRLKMAVYNTMRPVLLNNIFGSIEGSVEPDHYIIMGAQRDSWGPGAVKSGVGTALLMELARAFSSMVQTGFQPRRSLLFVSWDGGDFGNVGATEWLEGYLTMLHLKAVAYFSLDQAILGDDNLLVFSSPLLAHLIEGALRHVDHPKHSGQSMLSLVQRQGGWRNIVKPLYLNSGAYSFTAFGGVPAMQLHFTEDLRAYPFINTPLDTHTHIQELLQGRLTTVGRSLAELVGLMVLRLSHTHILPLDVECYSGAAEKISAELGHKHTQLQAQGLSPQWVFSARGDYSRAAKKLLEAIKNSDVQDERMARVYNARIMRVEYYFLSQYVSVVETPFRHVFLGRGSHTVEALSEHLSLLDTEPERFNEAKFRKQLALFTWTLQGAANALSGDVWNIDNAL